MTVLVQIAVWALTVYCVGQHVGHGWSRGRGAAPDRYALVRSGVDAALVLALVRAVLPPQGDLAWLSWVWVAAVVGVGVGVAGAILRWPTLPWRARREARSQRRAAASAGAYAVFGLAVLAVLL